MTQQAPELKPCPWCGGIPRIDLAKKTYCQLHGDPSQQVKVYCYHDCPARPHVFAGDVFNGGEEKARAEAIAAWNARAAPSHEAFQQMREALEELLRMRHNIMTDVATAHLNRRSTAFEWMREKDRDMVNDLLELFGRASAALEALEATR